MPSYTTLRRSNQRNLAIRRKGFHEASLLEDEDEDIIFDRPSQPLNLHKADQINVVTNPSSPVSVATAIFDEPSQLKPLVLPGAWVKVGKGGKPVKNGNDKMYEDPVKASKKKKKKKRTRARKADAEAEPPLIVTLEEGPSSSKCTQTLERSTARRTKAMMRSKEAKYWAGYQHAKQLKRGALDELVALLECVDVAEGDDALIPPTATTRTTKDHKANSGKDKIRRRARDAKFAARCFMHDDREQEVREPAVVEREMVRTTGSALEAGEETEVKLPGAWTTIGKRGKALADFPPLKLSDKAETWKRRAEHGAEGSGAKHRKSLPKSSEQLPQASSAEIKRAKSGKSMKCSVM